MPIRPGRELGGPCVLVLCATILAAQVGGQDTRMGPKYSAYGGWEKPHFHFWFFRDE